MTRENIETPGNVAEEPSSDMADSDELYRLQPDDDTSMPLPTESVSHWLDKAEAEVAAEQQAQRSSADHLKEDVGKWFQKARTIVSGLGQRTKSLADSGTRAAEIAKIKSVSLPRAYAALGRAIYQERRYFDQFAQLYSQLDDLLRKIDQLRNHAEDPAQTSVLDRAKQSLRRTADAATAKALSFQMAQHLQELGTRCFQQFHSECEPRELAEEIRSLLARIDEFHGKAEEPLPSSQANDQTATSTDRDVPPEGERR